MSTKVKYGLLALLLIITVTGTNYFFNWSMMVLVTFVLAYLGKGLRVRKNRGNE
ncbi:hypothetical protein [Gloeocapsa sp. PCC 73106]|uniref:hypothetical protein n=1 Tax=Gloeocapsa sp. PCC 73106 TaxID=102232 RepID=UPI0002AC679A|nr:hypothetical protein [Gloeocapsa sp. PCC 73106]ELR96544.1 hypothetical protein GLO73106DRAFT_00003380 [Gloeocapsa sp. PCC 73106]